RVVRGGGSALRGKKVPPKYRGPSGETWAGRGAKPRWLVAAIKGGKKPDDFLIDKAARKERKKRRSKGLPAYAPTPSLRWRRTMTQSDAEGEQGPNPPEASQPLIKSEEDVTDYHGQLLEQLRYVEDTINKFAIQNYAASGAVALAYLADKAPLWATII